MECCPKAVIGALASQMGAQLSCLGGIKNVGVQDWAAGHLVDLKVSVLPPLLFTGHMAMNADVLVPGSSVFYLRGTTGARIKWRRPCFMQILLQGKMGRCHGNKWQSILSRG